MPRSEADKDVQIDNLIGQAERLVSDLTATVANMKRILMSASENIEEARRVERPE